MKTWVAATGSHAIMRLRWLLLLLCPSRRLWLQLQSLLL
jgi:hypothetical protein